MISYNNIRNYYLSRVWSIWAFLSLLGFFAGLWLSNNDFLKSSNKEETPIHRWIKEGVITFCFAMVHLGIIVHEPHIRNLEVFRNYWGANNRFVDPIIILVALVASTLPCIVIGIDDVTSFAFIPGMCGWLFSIEKLLDAVTDVNLVNISLSIAVGVCTAQIGNPNTVTNIFAWVLTFCIPIVITLLRIRFPSKKLSPTSVFFTTKRQMHGNQEIELSDEFPISLVMTQMSEQDIERNRAAVTAGKDLFKLMHQNGRFLPQVYKLSPATATGSQYFSLVAYEP